MTSATRPKRKIEATTYEKPAENPESAPESPAPAPRKKAARKTEAAPAADTGEPRIDSAADGDLTLAGLADRYLKHMEDAGKSRGTVFSYSIDLGLACRHFGEKTVVTSLTPKKVSNFYESEAVTKTRSGKPKARPTIMKTRRVLRLALAWAAEAGLISEAPLP